jgi:hypothetical protein
MTENRININRKELTSQEVGEQENLQGIIGKHQQLTKRPAYKQKKFYFFLFLLLLIAYLFYHLDKEEKVKEEINVESTN